MKRKRFIKWAMPVAVMACLAMPVYAADKVESITEEVLTGPNELNPEKILGPGGVGIETSNVAAGTMKKIMQKVDTNNVLNLLNGNDNDSKN